MPPRVGFLLCWMPSGRRALESGAGVRSQKAGVRRRGATEFAESQNASPPAPKKNQKIKNSKNQKIEKAKNWACWEYLDEQDAERAREGGGRFEPFNLRIRSAGRPVGPPASLAGGNLLAAL